DRVFRDTLTGRLPAAPPAPPLRSLPSMMDFSVREMSQPAPSPPAQVGQALCFRYEFELTRRPAPAERQFRLTITSSDPELAAGVNADRASPDEKDPRGKREYWFPPKPLPKDRVTLKPAAGNRSTLQSQPGEDEVAAAKASIRAGGRPANLRGG